YLVHTERGPYLLTLYEKRVDPADLPFFLGLLEHLAKAGLNCPTPVRDAEGRLLRPLARTPAAAPLLGAGPNHGALASGGPELPGDARQCTGPLRLAAALCAVQCARR